MERQTELPGKSNTPTASHVDLRERGIDENQAAELRECLATFAEDWDAPEMEIYDEVFPHDQVKDENSDVSIC